VTISLLPRSEWQVFIPVRHLGSASAIVAGAWQQGLARGLTPFAFIVVIRPGSDVAAARAETMPAVTVPPRPNRLPTAITPSPTNGASGAKETNGKFAPSLTLSQREIGLRVRADNVGRDRLAVGGRDRP
jgi:hypothetical protein